jgi:hypothetical protein
MVKLKKYKPFFLLILSIAILLIVILIFSFVFLRTKKEGFENKGFENTDGVENKPSSKKLALLFLIYDQIEHEELWYKWLENIDKSKYSIYIHYKIPSTGKKLKYFENNKIENCIETAWGDISLVKAQNLLLENALKDPNNTNFIFLSNSCVPLKTFSHVYEFLDPSKSYFNLFKKEQRFPRYNKIKEYTKVENITKAFQWSILSRKHATLLYKDREIYYKWYNKVEIPDESCYLTYLNHTNLQNEIILVYDSANNSTTFVNWFDIEYKYRDPQGIPKFYNKINNEELDYLVKDSNCLFGRKFKNTCDLSYLKKLINLS